MFFFFCRIYQIQSKGEAFETIGALLQAINPKFVEYLNITTNLGFQEEGITSVVIDEIIMATIRANYGQNLNIHKMVGMSQT